MKPFSKNETFAVTAILLFTFIITFYNLNISLRRSRDAQRRSDIGAIANALNKYHDDFGFFPPSKEGKIAACKGNDFDVGWEELKKNEKFDENKFFELLVSCQWGKDKLADVTDSNYPAYMNVIPGDPKGTEGLAYLYLSNTVRFQIFSYLEGKSDEIGYDESIVKRGLTCGVGFTCSFGKSYASPLDRSIEEYENELLEKAKVGEI